MSERVAKPHEFWLETCGIDTHWRSPNLSDVTKAIKDTVVDTFEIVSTKAKQGASDAQEFIAKSIRKSKPSTVEPKRE